MSISLLGSLVGTHASTSAQTISFSTNLLTPGGTSVTLKKGDLLLAATNNATNSNRSEAQLRPSGYTAAHTDLYANDSNDTNFLSSYKWVGDTVDTEIVIPASADTTAGFGYLLFAFRGVDRLNPFDVAVASTTGINTGRPTPPAVTPVTAGAWIVALAGAAVSVGAVFTNPGDLNTSSGYFQSVTTTSTVVDVNIGGGMKTNWTSGQFTPTTWTGSTTTASGSWAAATIVLRPKDTLYKGIRTLAQLYLGSRSEANIYFGNRIWPS